MGGMRQAAPAAERRLTPPPFPRMDDLIIATLAHADTFHRAALVHVRRLRLENKSEEKLFGGETKKHPKKRIRWRQGGAAAVQSGWLLSLEQRRN